MKSYVKAKMLTHDPEQAARYEADPLIFRQIAVNVLLDLHDTSTRLLADAGAINADADAWRGTRLGRQSRAQRKFFNRLSSPVKRMEIFPALITRSFTKRIVDDVIGLVREFIRDCFAKAATAPSLVNADKCGYTGENMSA